MKGIEKLLDALLTFMEENPEIIAEGLNEIIEEMVAKGQLPHSCKESAKT